MKRACRILAGLVIVIGASHTLAGEPPRWIAELASDRASLRDAALSELPRRLLAIESMRELIVVAADDPEIESRGRAACEAHAALAPVLTAVARSIGEASGSVTRRWLEAALAAEIARRAPLDRLVARSGRSTLFTANVLTGLRLPRLGGDANALDFDRALGTLAMEGEFERPVALDPALDASSLSPVRCVEMLPSTSGGMLKRWLVPRELRVVDLGIVHLVTDPEVEERIAAARERQVDANRRRRIEFDSARLLADRLTRFDPGDEVARLRLWVALSIPGATSVARGLDSSGDAVLHALAALAPEIGEDEFERRVDAASPDLVRVVIEAYARGPGPRSDPSIGNFASRSSAVVRARLAAAVARRRVDASILTAAFEFPEIGVHAILGAGEGAIVGAIDPVPPAPVLSAAVGETALLEKLDRTTPLCVEPPARAAVLAALALDSTLFAEVRAYEAGVDVSEFGLAPPRIEVTDRSVRAFVLGACRPTGRTLDGTRADELVAMCARLAPKYPELARVCAVYVARLDRLTSSARELARSDEFTLRAAVSRAAILEANGDDALAYSLLFELRSVDKGSRTHAALYDELFAVVSAIDSGATRWFEILDRDLR